MFLTLVIPLGEGWVHTQRVVRPASGPPGSVLALVQPWRCRCLDLIGVFVWATGLQADCAGGFSCSREHSWETLGGSVAVQTRASSGLGA